MTLVTRIGSGAKAPVPDSDAYAEAFQLENDSDNWLPGFKKLIVHPLILKCFHSPSIVAVAPPRFGALCLGSVGRAPLTKASGDLKNNVLIP